MADTDDGNDGDNVNNDNGEEDADRGGGDFVVRWGAYRHNPLSYCPVDWIHWIRAQSWTPLRFPDFYEPSQRYLRYLDANPGAVRVPFGKKHRGKRMDECRDLPWMKWCCRQRWAQERYQHWVTAAREWLEVRPIRHYGVHRDIGERLTALDDIVPPEDYEEDTAEWMDKNDNLDGFIVPDDEEENEDGSAPENQSDSEEEAVATDEESNDDGEESDSEEEEAVTTEDGGSSGPWESGDGDDDAEGDALGVGQLGQSYRPGAVGRPVLRSLRPRPTRRTDTREDGVERDSEDEDDAVSIEDDADDDAKELSRSYRSSALKPIVLLTGRTRSTKKVLEDEGGNDSEDEAVATTDGDSTDPGGDDEEHVDADAEALGRNYRSGAIKPFSGRSNQPHRRRHFGKTLENEPEDIPRTPSPRHRRLRRSKDNTHTRLSPNGPALRKDVVHLTESDDEDTVNDEELSDTTAVQVTNSRRKAKRARVEDSEEEESDTLPPCPRSTRRRKAACLRVDSEPEEVMRPSTPSPSPQRRRLRCRGS